MNTVFYRDRQPRAYDMTLTGIDPAAQRRTLALDDAISHCRRAAAATSAACAGEQEQVRTVALIGIQQRLAFLLAQLQALT
jgi:hypothetical protein